MTGRQPRPLIRRVIGVAGALLLAAAVALAIVSRSDRDEAAPLPQAEGRYAALAGSSGPSRFGTRTACGMVIRPRRSGSCTRCCRAACGSTSAIDGKHVLTQVIGRGPHDAGRQFELTEALARSLGVTGMQRIQWSYAASCVTSATVARGVPDPVRDAAHHVEPTLREREPGSGIGAYLSADAPHGTHLACQVHTGAAGRRGRGTPLFLATPKPRARPPGGVRPLAVEQSARICSAAVAPLSHLPP